MSTPYAYVFCDGDFEISCGQVPLTEEEYLRQLSNPNRPWSCPKCGAGAQYDDAGSEKLMEERELADKWTLEQAVALCTKIHELPSQKFNCHPALTGGLLYKQGPRKDCDIVIYQRGDEDGERKPINWVGLWEAFEGIGLRMIQDYGYVKKGIYNGKPIDIFDPTQDGGNYGQTEEADEAVAEIAELI